MKKILLLTVVFVFLVSTNPVFAQSDNIIESIPKILPGNPLYFFKNIGQGLERLFAIGRVRRAELEISLIGEKAREIYAVSKKDNAENLQRAIENYNKNILRLKDKFSVLKKTSENPNVDRLLEKFSVGLFNHQELFDSLDLKGELGDRLEDARDELDQVFIEATQKLDVPKGIKNKLESAINNGREESLKEFKGLVVLNRLEGKSLESLKKELSGLKDDLILKFEGRLRSESVLELSEDLQKTNLIAPEKLQALDEIRERTKDQSLKSSLNSIRATSLNSDLDKKSAEETKQVIDAAITAVRELESMVKNLNSVSQSIKEILERADFNLEQAQKFHSDGKFGAAFGQATAALAAAKNGLSQIENKSNNTKDELKPLRAEFDSLVKRAKDNDFLRESNPKLYSLFDQVEKSLIESKTAEALSNIKITLAEIDVLTKVTSTEETKVSP
ncbi:MAG: hypothetical protein AAB617_00060 [Patescibacteria group bacterium]